MKRFSRLTALAVSAMMLVGVMSCVTASCKEIRLPQSVQDYAEMCGK